jgi:hypothetical protein
LTLLLKDYTEIEPIGRLVWILPRRVGEQTGGFLQLSHPIRNETQQMEAVGMMGIAGKDLMIQPLGVIKPPGTMMSDSFIEQRLQAQSRTVRLATLKVIPAPLISSIHSITLEV